MTQIAKMLSTFSTVSQVNTINDVFIDLSMAANKVPGLQTIQLQDITLFILGSFREQLLTRTPENQAFVDKLIFEQLIDANTHTLVKMRILWLLEKLSSHEQFFRDNKEEKQRVIFEKLVDIFIMEEAEA